MTNGHLDVLGQALNVTDTVVVGIGIQASKKPVFTFEERADLIQQSLAAVMPGQESRISVVSFDRLAVDAARDAGATIMIRGLRDGSDLDYEMQMAGMNREMAPDIQTVFLPSSPLNRPITATLVRQIAAMGGDVSAFVPAPVKAALNDKQA